MKWLLCLAPLSAGLLAQASVSGAIVDERGAPAIAAKLSLRGLHVYLTKSTEQGTFHFGRVEAGTFTLIMDQAGYCKTEIAGVFVKAGEHKTIPRVTLKVPNESGKCE
jgi:Carboxypeptidase regulatory-like domain